MNRRYLVPGLLLLLIQGCGDSTSPPAPSRIVVDPFTTSMDAVGETLQYSARLEDKKGREMPGVGFTWSTSDPAIATITPSGLLTGVKAGSVSVTASAEGISGNGQLSINPVPDELAKIAGDEQFGVLRQILPTQPTIEVLDANGYPVEGVYVSFSVVVGGGTATPWQVQTGTDGRASTVWQLGCSNDNPQRLDAKIGSLTTSFTATVDLAALAICQDQVPEGRETLPYSASLEAAGGDQGTLSWSIAGGALPPGLTLEPEGGLSGIPTTAGSYQFLAQVQDGQGGLASSQYNLRVCDAPILLGRGQSRVFSPTGPDGCGFFLPAGANGDRYRFGVVYTSSDENNEFDVPSVTVDMDMDYGVGLSSEPLIRPQALGIRNPELSPWVNAQASAALSEAVAQARASRASHYKIRMAERELIRNLGPAARPLPDRRNLTRVSGPTPASPEKVSFANPEDYTSCALGETRRGIKVKENDLMVIYQDSIQRDTDPLADNHAQWMLDHYAMYGAQVIDSYFGGVSDINEDGKVVVYVTAEAFEEFEDNTVAFVWNGDFFPKTNQPGWLGCEASNEMELIRFNLDFIKRLSDGVYTVLGTLVHETKHVSSLYKSLIRSDYYGSEYNQPLWVEEGTAEFAEETAARIAWAGAGGPAVGTMASRSDVTEFTRENFSVILVNAETTGYLSSQPNGVVVTPDGADEGHGVYGSGWHFHRWLGDAYGNAATPMADAGLLRTLNDSVTAVGVQGILEVTGAGSWAQLLEEYLAAIMLNGTSAPLGPRSFTSYDFPSMNRSFTYDGKPDGDYPWSVNVSGTNPSAPFASSTSTGLIGPSGVRIYDVTSNGNGLGLEVTVTAGSAISPFRIVLVRVE